MQHTLRYYPARPIAAYLLCKHAERSQREAADRLGYGTGAAVCIQIKRLRSAMQTDREIAGVVKRLEERLWAES